MTESVLKLETTRRELADALERDGFVLLPSLCDESLLAHVREVSSRRARALRQALAGKEIGIGSAAGFDEIVQRSPGRWDVPITPEEFGVDVKELPWWPLVAQALGEDAEHSFSGVVSSDPESPEQFWHADSPHESAEHRPAHALNVLVALNAIPLEMGPTECARGSHRLTNHLSNPNLVVEQLIYQHASTSPESLVEGTEEEIPKRWSSALTAGSCLVFDDRLLHRGQANRSRDIRHVAYFSYRRAGYSSDAHFEAQRSVFEEQQS